MFFEISKKKIEKFVCSKMLLGPLGIKVTTSNPIEFGSIRIHP